VAAFRTSDSDAPADALLIERTLAGDGGAYAILVERYQRKIYRVAYSIVRDDVEADTIAQDTFVQAYTHLARFEGRAGLETWLTRIAINLSRDTLRRRRFVNLFTFRNEDDDSELVLEPVDERPDPERQYLSMQLRAAITRAERQLSPQQLVIFRLRHYENLTPDDIATHLGLSAATVRVHLFRATHKIRRELADWRAGRGRQESGHETALQ
jgi:RNA polymerase sigma-70 factor, ECF subfamily